MGPGFRGWVLRFEFEVRVGREPSPRPHHLQGLAQYVGQHILLDVQGAVLALVVRQ